MTESCYTCCNAFRGEDIFKSLTHWWYNSILFTWLNAALLSVVALAYRHRLKCCSALLHVATHVQLKNG